MRLKTFIAATVGDGYIHLTARTFGVGGGMWEMAPDQLERYRQAVVDERSGRKLALVVEEARAAGLETTGHDVLRTAPRGYPKDHPRLELLRYKGLIARKEWTVGAWLGTRRAKDRVEKFLQLLKPLNAWLRENAGVSSAPRTTGDR